MKRSGNTEFAIAALAWMLSICATAAATSGQAAEGKMWPHPTFYTVIARPGETLTSLSSRYGVPAAIVAKLNRLDIHHRITAGEVLRIPAGSTATREAVLSEALDTTAPNYAPPPKAAGRANYLHAHEIVAAREPGQDLSAEAPNAGSGPISRLFVWPVRGPVISSFGPATDGQRNDGINIGAMLGAPIHAAAAGTVTYAGDELKAYGNLILIAHSGGYITAYAHAQHLVVARGEHVEKGQVIGTAGETGGVDRPQVHFEIRLGVKPVNPVRLLAALP